MDTILSDTDYHPNIVRNQLTRSMTTTFEDICDEIARAFSDLVPLPEKEGGEWHSDLSHF